MMRLSSVKVVNKYLSMLNAGKEQIEKPSIILNIGSVLNARFKQEEQIFIIIDFCLFYIHL